MTVDLPQSQLLDRVVDVLLVMLRQSSLALKGERTAEISPMPNIDIIDGVHVAMQSQVPTIKRVQRIMNSTHVQLIVFDTATLIPCWNVRDFRSADVRPNSSGDLVA